MIMMDWTEAAADDIYCTMADEGVTRELIQEIIQDHCPFKQGVIYVPFRKCERCAGIGEVSCDSIYHCDDPEDGYLTCPSCNGMKFIVEAE
jgi:hypothetical protein